MPRMKTGNILSGVTALSETVGKFRESQILRVGNLQFET